MVAELSEPLDVFSDNRVLVHMDVHSGRDQDRSSGCQQNGCQKIVGDSCRDFANDVRRRRRNHERIRAVGQIDMSDF